MLKSEKIKNDGPESNLEKIPKSRTLVFYDTLYLSIVVSPVMCRAHFFIHIIILIN